MGASQREDELNAWLALIRLPGIGATRGRALLETFGSPRRLLDADETALREAGLPGAAGKYLSERAWEADVEPDLAWLRQAGHHLITFDDSLYPPLLREIADPPLALFVLGDRAQLSQPQIAIVGSRNPTPGGERTAEQFAASLCSAGLAITSGLAVGIDAAAHRGALGASGRTFAVAGTGLDRVYPARHRELAHAVIENGALVSEFPIGTPPRPDHFPRRNRIISGLSMGTLVVEANPQSGSLITARLAAEQGREVFAIPGSIHNPLARGCHALIRQGAKLVETVQDILEELPGSINMSVSVRTNAVIEQDHEAGNQKMANLLNFLGFEPITIDDVVARSGLTAEQVSSMLVVLELQGKVACGPGGIYSRMP